MFDTRSDNCHDGKQSKARITVLLAANVDGSTKLHSFVNREEELRCMIGLPQHSHVVRMEQGGLCDAGPVRQVADRVDAKLAD
ncbi:hypothetical protein HPB48_019494 [Haemaphysalis longicornis]|uniref:Uncharacterized protein n=1 Tax=Haemaphysalis longicornis TaxID=44386 RepID=A0A9J6FZ74_HAELO|nr:hypothetical protein HPB48_019494 [Haemaphysalis longicornis]